MRRILEVAKQEFWDNKRARFIIISSVIIFIGLIVELYLK